MTSTDLFSFLDHDHDSEASDSEITSNAMQVDGSPHSQLAGAPTPSNKRSVDSPPPRKRVNSTSLSPQPEDLPPSKRQRLEVSSASVPAVVVDEFETEAKREVAASAGLTGATEIAGSRLELRHQVRLQTPSSESLQLSCSRFDIKSPYHQVILMFLLPPMSRLRSLHASTSSPWILFSKFPSMPSNETRVFSCLRILVQERPSSQSMPLHRHCRTSSGSSTQVQSKLVTGKIVVHSADISLGPQ
jgi:hypothetical protein